MFVSSRLWPSRLDWAERDTTRQTILLRGPKLYVCTVWSSKSFNSSWILRIRRPLWGLGVPNTIDNFFRRPHISPDPTFPCYKRMFFDLHVSFGFSEGPNRISPLVGSTFRLFPQEFPGSQQDLHHSVLFGIIWFVLIYVDSGPKMAPKIGQVATKT